MKVRVIENHSDRVREFSGDASKVRRELWQAYGKYLRNVSQNQNSSIHEVLHVLNRQQAFTVDVLNDDIRKSDNLDEAIDVDGEIVNYMHGYKPYMERAFEAARFLASAEPVSAEVARASLWQKDGDYTGAALHAFGLEDNDENRAALKAILSLKELDKSLSGAALPKDAVAQAALAEGDDVAEAIQRAIRGEQVMTVQLGGKHSKGSLLAKDPKTKTVYLLKPGSGPQSPAAGAREEGASQSQREACFYHVAKLWGIDHDFPHCQLIVINGHQYAVMDLLPWDYKPLEKMREKSPGIAKEALDSYLRRGRLHQWAVIDYVLGNPDRHGQNLMIGPKKDVKLIDHGSAFAGSSFDPAYDKNSFVPFYLRYTAPTEAFNALEMKDKLRYMPQAPQNQKVPLRQWVMDIHADALSQLLARYGIDPQACLDRLAKLKATEGSIDVAINVLWAGT